MPVIKRQQASQRRAVTNFREAPKTRAIAKPEPRADEPEVIGPPNDFPPSGTCQYTRDDVAKLDWRMCGHPGFPWCQWHLENRISPKAA